MTTTPCMYSDTQLKKIESFIEENFGSHFDDYVVHEIVSEYVHTDVFRTKTKEGEKTYITCGMGARDMNAPHGLKRCELVMLASKEFKSTEKDSMLLAAELVRISKFPFREKTWIGTGHTIDASKEFKELFGYDYFTFMKLPLSAKLSEKDDEVNFLLVIPIYEVERKWCVENHTMVFLENLHQKHNGMELHVDFKREAFIPDRLNEDEIYDYNLMTIFGINRPTLCELYGYLEEQEQNGVEVSFESIEKWVKAKR